MNRPEVKLVPDEIWQGMVRYGVTPSMNIVLDNGRDEFLFVLRGNEPVKGHLWVPGGRLRNGETREQAVIRIAEEEIGVRAGLYDILHISDRSNEEIYPIAEMGDQEEAMKRYGPGVKTVHYWGGVSYVKLHSEAAITLDSQSKGYEWLSAMPKNPHPYLQWYVDTVKQAGFPVPPPASE